MQKFLVIYCMPAASLGEWMQKSESERKEAEGTMKGNWDAWLLAHPQVKDSAGAGKNTRVTTAGAAAAANDVMITATVEADSQEAAVQLFVGHPHLAMPGAWIDIMPTRVL